MHPLAEKNLSKNRFLLREILITNVSNDTQINDKEPNFTIYPLFLIQKSFKINIKDKKGV